jgi:hypothetical protein
MIYLPNVDAAFARAVAAGAKVFKPVMDQFYGDRSGQLEDPFGHIWWVATHPFGHIWWVATHKEDVSPEGRCVSQVQQKRSRVKSWEKGLGLFINARQGEVAAAGAPQGKSSGAGAQPEQPVCEQAVAFTLGGL